MQYEICVTAGPLFVTAAQSSRRCATLARLFAEPCAFEEKR